MSQLKGIPTIRLNGTSPRSLIEGLDAAYHALDAACRALRATAPNARDYYVQGPHAIKDATQEYMSRIERVRSVQDEIESLISAIQDQTRDTFRRST
jgi:hypothetical protein